MPDPRTALTTLAVSVFRERTSPTTVDAVTEWRDLGLMADPVLHDAQRASRLVPTQDQATEEIVDQIFAEPDLLPLRTREGVLNPMLLGPGGGARTSPTGLVTSLLTSALLQIYYLRLPLDESTFVRSVVEGFAQLRRAARGEQIRGYLVIGIAGVTLPEGAQVSTPWGVLRPAPKPRTVRGIQFGVRPQTTCLLAEPRLFSVRFDRAADPTWRSDPAESSAERTQVLFPLACALASNETANPAVPLVTFVTFVLPFQHARSYDTPLLPPRIKPAVDIADRGVALEEWSRVVDGAHTPSVDIAARRLVSASAQRMDDTDALIDAVVVWENLVGTSSELTFRVTAALAKALEPDRVKRRALQKSLAKVYAIRSRVVHGAAVKQTAISDWGQASN
jgi:hypothetical protein